MIEIYLPIPPTINHYYKPKQGSYAKYIGDEGKLFRQKVLVIKHKLKLHIIQNKLLKIDIKFIFNNNYANDIDNRVKPLLDAMQYAKFLDDDKNIIEMNINKLVDKQKKESFCKVCIEILENTPQNELEMPKYLLELI